MASFVDSAPDGVVMFSLGYSGFQPAVVPRQLMQEFIKAFRQLKQRVVMRFDPELLDDIPENVMVVKWIPQEDLLGEYCRGGQSLYKISNQYMSCISGGKN